MNRFDSRWPAAAALVAALFAATPVSAQTVFCTNCGTELTQLANNVQLVDQLARQVELVRQAIQQSENMLLNTAGLDNQDWGTPIAEIRRLNALLGRAKSLSFTASGLDAQFAKKYGDYNAYVAHEVGEEGLAAKYQQWSEDTNSLVLTTLKAAGLSAEQIEGEEDAYLRSLEDRATTAEGRMQAIQIGSQIAMAGVRQTQKLRQILLMQTQLLANALQRQSDREAAEAAALRRFGRTRTLPAGNGRRY
jgi:P-type conjugative transfer protein TrbJ